MRKFRWLSTAICSVALVWSLQIPIAAATTVKVVTDRADAMYHVGERVTFLISVAAENQPVTSGEVSYTLTLDGAKKLGGGKCRLGTEPATVESTLTDPGILRCAVSYVADGKPVTAMAGAAVDPLKIPPTAVAPDDFDAFWDGAKKQLAAVPMNAQLTKVDRYCTGKKDVYKLRLDNVNGSHVYGWLGVPKGKGPFPAVLTVPAAGVYPISPAWTNWADDGVLCLGISAHDYDVDLPADEYKKLGEGALNGYGLQGRENRETYYFYRVILGCLRAVDYLTSRSDWDGKHLVINGSSQGGGLSLLTAGLDRRITAVSANVPAMCDHSGSFFGRPSGWPRLVPPGDEKILKVSEYYDAVNTARRIHVPCIFGVGLIDNTCAATTVYSAYNVIQAPKEIVASPLMGHAISPEFVKRSRAFIAKHISD